MSSLRSMDPDDLLNFTDCNLDPLTETYGIGFYLEYLGTWPHLCYVMESHDGRIEGYILAKVEASPSPNVPTSLPYNPDTNKNPHYLPWHAHITALTVAPRDRRLGHARKLTEVLEQQGDAEDAWFVDLFVRADNEVALKLYASMGYSIYRRVIKYYNDDADAFDMRKSLKRDKDGKHVRKDGDKHHVDPSAVW
ncbi:MAG: N-terminal acetyltransferase [Chrysothrix sp. TS-e1954]|nr:MAG: N-terminal acetyltransferase [Chrysothrix sp. TS-e1954]